MRTKERQPFHFSIGLVLLGLLGGGIGGLFWGLGQESKFRCGKCGKIFFSHTKTSRVFSILCILTYATVATAIAYGLWQAFHSH